MATNPVREEYGGGALYARRNGRGEDAGVQPDYGSGHEAFASASGQYRRSYVHVMLRALAFAKDLLARRPRNAKRP